MSETNVYKTVRFREALSGELHIALVYRVEMLKDRLADALRALALPDLPQDTRERFEQTRLYTERCIAEAKEAHATFFPGATLQ